MAWLGIFSIQRFRQWATDTQTHTALYIQRIDENSWQESGQCDWPVLDYIQPEHEHLLLANMHKSQFLSHPQWQGQYCETTNLGRTDSPLLIELKKYFGNGLLVRVVARLTELVMLTQQLLPNHIPEEKNLKLASVKKAAIGQATAARGRLFHQVSLDGNKINHYKILAPTDWNFHSRSIVVKSLSLLHGSHEQITQQAKLLIENIDPCVAYQLKVHHEALHHA